MIPKSILNVQTISDEKEQALKRYGDEEKAKIYIEGLCDGARCYELPQKLSL